MGGGYIPAGRGNGGGRTTGGVNLRLLSPKHNCKLNRDQAHYGRAPSGGETPGDKGVHVVV